MSLFSLLLCSVFWGTPYIIYGREKDFSQSVFRTVSFLKNSMFFVPFPFFSNMLHNGFRHADGFSFSFVLMQKNKVTKKKNQGYVSGPTPERPFWR